MDNIKIPKHLAIILDGNGRWAKERNKPRSYGHKVGFNNLKSIAIYANKLGIKALSVYCFSTENWNRPKNEVDFLMSIPQSFESDIPRYIKENIRVIFSGRTDRIPEKTLSSLSKIKDATSEMTGLTLNICFDYGAINELSRAINEIILDKKDVVDEETIFSYLDTRDLPKIDLLIRCGGEKRLSNFLLLQSAYAELYFTDTYWPDFNKDELDKALLDYTKRDRRFGGIKEWKT